MAVKRSSKRRGGIPVGRIIAAVLAVVLLAGAVLLGFQLVHRCDNCDKVFFGTGYYANAITDALSTLNGNGEKLLCRECAETDHALEILAGKSLEDFRRPLFGSGGK